MSNPVSLSAAGPDWRRMGQRMGRLAATLATALILAACSDNSAEPPVADPPAAPTAPSITTQPAAQTVSAGGNAGFSVVAAGTGPLSYQWQRDGVDIAGATAAAYTLAAVDLPDDGAQFRVVVRNSAGSATSQAAALTVQPLVIAPTITVQPQSASSPDGGSASFTVGVDGTPPYTYQWRRNGVDIAEANAAVHETPPLALADHGAVYTVVVGNSAGSVTSAAATLTVNPVAPAITAEPASLTVVAGQTAGFAVTATGSQPLTYQWRRNGTPVTGATADRYTTPALATADNGARYDVLVGNSAGTVTSAPATVTVTATAVAPSITTAPRSLSVELGQPAVFDVVAGGTAPLSYQWRRNGVDLAGATDSRFAIEATEAEDDAARFSVQVSNAAGTVTSPEAALTVLSSTSPLQGRGWATGQALESNDLPVLAHAEAIDDLGRVVVLFLKSDGTRNVLYATHGTPNGAGATPTWTAPTPIDRLGGQAVNNMSSSFHPIRLGIAPGGNAVAQWAMTGACTATSYNTRGTNCRYWYAARYIATSGSWEEPVALGSFPEAATQAPLINDRGDVAIRFTGWVRNSAGTGYNRRVAVVHRTAGEASYRTTTLGDATLAEPWLGMDGAGRLLLAAEATAAGTTDIVAYRGDTAAGLGEARTLDTRGNAATLSVAAVGRGGQQAVVWTQNNGTRGSVYIAFSAGSTADWEITDLTAFSYGARRHVVIDHGGTVYFAELGNRLRWRRLEDSGWTTAEAIPASNTFGGSYACTVASSGDFVCVNELNGGGTWTTYDARRNVIVQRISSTSPGPGYVLGVNTINRNIGMSEPLLSVSGHGYISMFNRYDVLPSPAAPAGDRRTIDNLWGAFLK